MHIETYPVLHFENTLSDAEAELAQAAAQRLSLPQQDAAITHAQAGGPITFRPPTSAQLNTCLVLLPKVTPLPGFSELIPPRVLDLVSEAVAQDEEGAQQWLYFVLHNIGGSPEVPVRVVVRVPEQDGSSFGWTLPHRIQLVALWVVGGGSGAMLVDTMDPWGSLQGHASAQLSMQLHLQAQALQRRAQALADGAFAAADLFVRGMGRHSDSLFLTSPSSIAGPTAFTLIKDL